MEPGVLHFRKDPEVEKEYEPTIDLRTIRRFTLLDEKKDKYGPRLVIEIPPSGDVRLRFNSAEDVGIWKIGLEEWKKYADDHPHLFDDLESGEVSVATSSGQYRSRIESIHNPLSPIPREDVSDDIPFKDDKQQFLPISIEDDPLEMTKSKNKNRGGFISFLSRKNQHHSLPTDPNQQDEEEPETISPVHDMSNRNQTISPQMLPKQSGTSSGTSASNKTSIVSSISSPSTTSTSSRQPFFKSPPPPPSPPSPSIDLKPEIFEGWLEKKNKGGLGSAMKIGHAWNRRYFRVLEKTGQLAYYSSDKEASINPSESVDLRLVIDITPCKDPSNAEYFRFDIELDDKLIQLRASSAEERERWVNELNEWKDYFLMNMH